MRPIILLLLAAAVAHAQLAEPPLAEVLGNNSAAAAALDGYYNASHAHNGTITLRFGAYTQSPNISVSVLLAGLSPSIDNLSCVSDDLALVAARGHREGRLISIPYPGYHDFSCDKEWHDSIPPPSMPLRCDFDGDDCSEFVNRTIVEYHMNVTYTFRNESATVPFASTLVAIPPSLLPLLENASGSEGLLVEISGHATFIYEINDQYIDFNTCHANYTNFTSQVPVSANQTFLVGGKQKLFFLAAPVLREQWFRNNRFDVVVLSQCPLYHAEFLLNNASMANRTLRSFNMSKDELNYTYIVSVKSEPRGWAEHSDETITPVPLEAADNSFAFAYRFNSSYYGLGENNLSLIIRDSALSTYQHNETLLSRMVSFGGAVTETGQNISAVPSRPSVAFAPGELLHLEISLGLVGLVLVLAFLNFWAPR